MAEALRLKPDEISVQRISAGIDDESLIAPEWCRDKNAQIKAVNDILRESGFKY